MNTRIRKLVICYFLSTIAMTITPVCKAEQPFHVRDIASDGRFVTSLTDEFLAVSSSLSWTIGKKRLLSLETEINLAHGTHEMSLKAGVVAADAVPLSLDQDQATVTLLGIRIDF